MGQPVRLNPIRLNLGCGRKLWEGFINCDFPGNWSEQKPDVECDIRKLPFPDDYADEIHAIHVIEHFDRREVNDILMEWRRVLKPGGLLALECPCLDKIMKIAVSTDFDNDTETFMRMVMLGLYGEFWKGGGEMLHKWCYCISELKGILKRLKFKNIEREEPLFHVPPRDMRFVCRK